MYVAIVGSRRGVPAGVVGEFVKLLAQEEPDAIVVSGGAMGVDTCAEQTFLNLGREVISYRAARKPGKGEESWLAEEWKLGTASPLITPLEPTFADRTSALFYRNMLIVDLADKVVSFHAAGSPGTAFTKGYAKDRGKPVYEMLGR